MPDQELVPDGFDDREWKRRLEWLSFSFPLVSGLPPHEERAKQAVVSSVSSLVEEWCNAHPNELHRDINTACLKIFGIITRCEEDPKPVLEGTLQEINKAILKESLNEPQASFNKKMNETIIPDATREHMLLLSEAISISCDMGLSRDKKILQVKGLAAEQEKQNEITSQKIDELVSETLKHFIATVDQVWTDVFKDPKIGKIIDPYGLQHLNDAITKETGFLGLAFKGILFKDYDGFITALELYPLDILDVTLPLDEDISTPHQGGME